MIVVKVRDRDIKAAPMGPVTTGSERLPVRWYFDEAWDELTKIAVFRVNDTYGPDMAILEDVCIVPNQLLVQDNAGENLWIGVYGRDLNGEIAVPTIWTYIRIEDGAVPQTVDPAEPTPEWPQQVQNAADEALRVAHGVRQDAEAWAVGERSGEPVPATDKTYENNAKYYAEQAGETAREFSEITAPAAVRAVNEAGAAAVQAVNTGKAGALDAISTAGQTAVSDVDTAKYSAILDISNAKTKAVDKIEDTSTTEQAAVEQKGEDALAALQEYADLPGEVRDLKSAVLEFELIDSSQPNRIVLSNTSRIEPPVPSGSSDYDSLTNKPSINERVLVGDTSLSELGIGRSSNTDINNLF